MTASEKKVLATLYLPALLLRYHAGHGHHEDNQASHGPCHEVQPEDDLAQR